MAGSLFEIRVSYSVAILTYKSRPT